MRRRTYLATATATTLGLSIAGCLGDDEGDESNPDGNSSDDGPNDDHSGGGTDEGGGGESESEATPDLVGTFDDFEDLDAWDVVVGSLEADGTRAVEGSQSAHMAASESEEQIRIRRSLSDPIDVRDVVPGLALSISHSGSVAIQLHDADGDYLQYQQYGQEDHPFVRQNFGHVGVSGDPDTSAITTIQIGHWTGDEREGELWVDDLHFVPRVTPGRVMIQFQGGFETDYTHAFPVMQDHGLTGSTFVPTARIRGSEDADGARLAEPQLAELVDAGWSVGTVGARHQQLHRVESDEARSDILDPLDWFDIHGYDDARYFAFPGGRYDEAELELVAEHYEIGWAGRHRAQGWASNPFTLTRISGEVGQRNLDAEEMIDALDWTAEHGGLTTIVFYEMDDDDAEALDETAGHLADLVSAGELELITPREIADEFVP